MSIDSTQLPVGHMLVILFDAKGEMVIEEDTPCIINHSIINDESKFTTLSGVATIDLRNVGYTLAPLEDIVRVIKKENSIRFFQKA